MTTPDSSIDVPFSKGAADESFHIPTGIEFAPIDEFEQRAAQDPDAIQIPRAQWGSYLARLKGRDVTPETIRNITNLPEEDAAAIYKGLAARGLLEQEYQRTLRGRQLGPVTLRDRVTIDQDNPPREWGVVIVDHELNGHDRREREAQVYPIRPNPKASQRPRQQQPEADHAGERRGPEGPQGPQSAEEKPYFETSSLLQLNADIASAIRDEAHRRKDERGVAKLPNDEFRALSEEIREAKTQEYLGSASSEDLMNRIDAARRSALAAQRRSSGPRPPRPRV